MKWLLTLVFFFLSTPVGAGTIDVSIKGFDDGIRTTKQQDYKEACLFAKREAIERAGVKIESITRVKNLVLMEDYIEQKAAAVLMPGYEIIDIGYNEVGTYVVVLVGKITTHQEDSYGIMSKEWYVQKEHLNFLEDRIECLEDGFKLVQVYDEKAQKIGKWKFYAKLKLHRSLEEVREGQSKISSCTLYYGLYDRDNDLITYAKYPLYSAWYVGLYEFREGYTTVEAEGKGEIRAEDIERVRSRRIAVKWD